MTGALSGERFLRALYVSTGILTALCLLIVLADACLLIVLIIEKAHNAWYFPYSLFVLPVLLVSAPICFLSRWALRKRHVG